MSITKTATQERRTGDPLLTIDQAAEYLAIPKATLYTWRTRRSGFGPRAVKIGGCLRFRLSDLDTWIDVHVEQPEPTTTGSQGLPAEPSLRGRASSPLAGVAMTRRRHPRV